ncbi:MAG TPA: hypothetical protein PK685_02355 [archaeon]|nr:hypothetical protein [archaeon]
MDYIDWIISSFIFLLMVSLILISISSVIPLNTQDDLYSKSIFSGVTETVPIYNFKLDSLDSEIYPYVIDVNSAAGVGQNLFLIDNNKYFSVIKNTNQFFDYNFNNPTDAMGILVLKENFNDFNYLDSFTLLPDTNINAGILELKEPTIITTNSEFYDFFGFVSTTNSIIAYVSYTDVNNNYFCRFGDSTITIGKTENAIQTILQTTNYSKTNDWHRVYFGYTKDNLIICNVGETDSNYQDANIIPKTNVVISTIYNNTLIDDFYIYLNNDISSDSNTSTVNGNYFDTNISDNLATVTLTDAGFSAILDFNFDENLIVPDTNGITLIKTESEDNKLGIFSQSKEFWIFKDSDENIEITFDENTGLDLDISEIEDLSLWLDASSLELEDGALVSSWTDLSGNENHATQDNDGNKPTFKTNILNGKPAIRFGGNNFLKTEEFSTLSQPNSIFLVFAAIENTGYVVIDGTNDTERIAFGSSGPTANDVTIFGGGVVNSNETLPQDWAVWGGIYNTTDSKIIKNGLIKNTGNVGTQDLNGVTIGCRYSLTRFMDGNISEILIYNSALSDSNRLLIENYLSQKYDLDVENGLDLNGTSVELINLNSPDKKILLEFLDNETLSPVDCNYSYKNKKLTITGCSSDIIIKIRFRNNGIIPTNQKTKITKTKEKIITKDKFYSLSGQSYYLKLYNKILSLENTTNRPTTKIYKNTTQYLTENGFLENVFVEIKPFN